MIGLRDVVMSRLDTYFFKLSTSTFDFCVHKTQEIFCLHIPLLDFHLSMAAQLKLARWQIVNDLNEPNIKAICDNLLQKNVINKFERDSMTHRMLDRADMARQLVDTVISKGNNASTLMIEALQQVDQHLFKEIERNLALANHTVVQAGAQGAPDAPPNYNNLI